MEQLPNAGNPQEHTPGKRPKHILRTVLLILLGIVLLMGAVVAFLGLNLLNKLDRTGSTTFEDENAVTYTPTPAPTATPALTSGPTPSPTPTPIPTPLPLSELYNQTILTQEQLDYMDANLQDSRFIHVLLIGVDTSGRAGRSDVMMLASIDPQAGRIRLVSFLRDLYVTIPGHGKDRLNAAYFYGGEELLLKTLEENFGVSADHTLTAYFPTLVTAVDLLGGVEADITKSERQQLNKILEDYNRQVGLAADDGLLETAGEHLLNGRQALSYCRIRKIDSDFQRTGRQQQLIESAAEQVKAMNLLELLNLAVTLLDEVETDLTLSDLAALAPLLGCDTLDIQGAHVPFDGAYVDETIDGMMVLTPDLPANRSQLKRFLEGD